MDRHFDRPHVDPSRQTEIGIEQVAMPVLLGRPPSQPACPGRVGRAGRVPGRVLQRDGVVRQGFFRDHIANEDDQKLVGDAQSGLAEPLELLGPVLRRQVREIIRRLPRLVHGSEQREVFPDELGQAFDEVPIDTLLHRHHDDPDRMALQPRRARFQIPQIVPSVPHRMKQVLSGQNHPRNPSGQRTPERSLYRVWEFRMRAGERQRNFEGAAINRLARYPY